MCKAGDAARMRLEAAEAFRDACIPACDIGKSLSAVYKPIPDNDDLMDLAKALDRLGKFRNG